MPDTETLAVPLTCPLDLAATLDGGQAFRWNPVGEGWWEGPIGRTVVRLRVAEGPPRTLEVRRTGQGCSEQDLRAYLGLDDSLDAARAALERCGVAADALSRSVGLRMLRQDPWETLVGFILSTNSNIPRIKGNLEYLARNAGAPIAGGSREWRTLPAPADIAALGEDRLREGRLGYRAAHLARTACALRDGLLNLDALSREPFDTAREALTGLSGVGPKVADCVLAYSLGFGRAFPVDTWVRKAVRRWWPGAAPESPERIAAWGRQVFGENAASAQLILFAIERSFQRRNGC